MSQHLPPSQNIITQAKQPPIRGRFAPSPTGELHLGSLTTAVASYCHVKSLGGQWLLRIEDTDRQRCQQKYTKQILKDLDALGLHWDDEVVYQSQRGDIYEYYLTHILDDLSYACDCSRKTLKLFLQQAHEQKLLSQQPLSQNPSIQKLSNHTNLTKQTVTSNRYPRFCLGKHLDKHKHKLRLQLPDNTIVFVDGIQGVQKINPQQSEGDMVVRRANGIINYILAASIDDGLTGITHVMRGLDILPMTAAQISIMQAAKLPKIEHWYHLPLILNKEGQKLSKQNLAKPIDTSKPSELLQMALKLLKQPTVELDSPKNMLVQAIYQWDMTKLQGLKSL